MTPPRITLIVNTADQPDYLLRVLRALEGQTRLPQEILLADDGSGEATRKVIAGWMERRIGSAAHIWQQKAGFRRARILNQAIARGRGDYLVFLDGDTIPHPRFVEDHGRVSRHGFFVQGHRALIQQQAAQWFGTRDFGRDRRAAFWQGQLGGWKHAFRYPIPFIRIRRDLRGIRGCNLAVWREDLLQVNGYNEEFIGWGREDSELAVRLLNSGVRRRDVRGWALCYHLWHPPASRAEVGVNDALLAEAVGARATRCERGLAQHLKAEA